MLEIASLCKKIESLDTSDNEESKNLIKKKVENNKFEFELVKGNENIASSKAKAFKDEMRSFFRSIEAKEKLCATQQALGLVKKKVRNLKEIIKSNNAKYKKKNLDEVKRETEMGIFF
ncbi:hypothetical protein H5410_015080, partial [Solanum commersonii]